LDNKYSLLAKIIGVYTVEMEGYGAINIMLMENTLQLQVPRNLMYIFDLKGSSVSRTTTGNLKPSTTLKDNNFRQLNKIRQNRYSDSFCQFNNFDRLRIISGMRKDCAFLRRVGLMDYSLLLAIEKVDIDSRHKTTGVSNLFQVSINNKEER